MKAIDRICNFCGDAKQLFVLFSLFVQLMMYYYESQVSFCIIHDCERKVLSNTIFCSIEDPITGYPIKCLVHYYYV